MAPSGWWRPWPTWAASDPASTHRDARRRRHRLARRVRPGHDRERRQLPACGLRSAGSRVSRPVACTATWPGAATGSIWCTTTAWRSRWRTSSASRGCAWKIRQALAAAGRHRSRRPGNRPHRAVRPAAARRGRQQELRPLSRPGLRPLALRHRHQRQAGLPGRRRQTSAGQVWRQESIVGSIFEGSVEIREGRIYPRIRGSAYITGEAKLVLDPRDPFVHGIPSMVLGR